MRHIQHFVLYENDGKWADTITMSVDPMGKDEDTFLDDMRAVAKCLGERFACECRIREDMAQVDEELVLSVLERLTR